MERIEAINFDRFEDKKKEVRYSGENQLLLDKQLKLFDKRIWRVSDVAKFLDCSVGHIYNLCSMRLKLNTWKLQPRRKKGKFLFFVPNEILEWVLQGDCI
ncbi:MAG: hypothetical protein CME63_13465 [Halobacteriovoraceae bacterium]|nr:hypothetical protein [Halobacteriovoraceae bacterium]